MRLYPIDYRYRPRQQQFKKYQWIEIKLASHGAGNDSRKESRKPDLESPIVAGELLSTANNWAARRAIIDKMPHLTLNQYKQQFIDDHVSLGIVRPSRILDMKIEPEDREWKPEWQAVLNQFTLDGKLPKPLTRIPYKFSYIFECEDDTKPHTAMCEDWELGVLFLKEVDRLGSEEAAAQSVKKKFFEELCAPDKDTQFFMGTVFPNNAWIVLGVFYPPKTNQLSLF